jgi:L-threonylcarbamoyladenylate synthase
VKQVSSKLVKWDDLYMELISNCTQDQVAKAAQAIKEGHLVAFPTETVYGLGADATNEKAVNRIYAVKGRPSNHPIIVHISSVDQIYNWAREVPKFALELASNYWPGPMTLIFKKSQLAQGFVTGGQDNIGLRVPNHWLAQELLKEFKSLGGLGIAAPSANKFGAVSPTTSASVVDELGKYLAAEDLILDGGDCEVGIESTIIDCTNDSPLVLRPGAITLEMIQHLVGFRVNSSDSKIPIRASGLLESHYSPTATVVLDSSAFPEDGFIALAEIPTPPRTIRLAAPSDIKEYANVLYKALRLGDQKGVKRIIAIQPPGEGLATAIRDRLRKAAGGDHGAD